MAFLVVRCEWSIGKDLSLNYRPNIETKFYFLLSRDQLT